MRRLIFIGGIHGSGKGTVCKEICDKWPVKHLSASDLIKWKEISLDEKNKKVANVSLTQERLIIGLNAATVTDRVYLLDGHFCLLNKDNQTEKVPMVTFTEIAPMLLSIVIDDVNTIQRRLSTRDGKDYSFDVLEKMQQAEQANAKEVATQLNIPLIVIRNGDQKELIQLLNKIVS